MKRVLLIRPDSQLPVVRWLRAFLHLEPLALEHLAGVVHPNHPVKILDLTLERHPLRALKKVLRRFPPDLVGITAYSNQIRRASECARVIREVCPEAMIVLGGHHATILPDDCRIPDIDLLVRGEGCGPFRGILDAMEQGAHSFSDIPNVYPPNAEDFGSIPPYPGADALPEPRRDLVDPSDYFCAWSSPKKKKGASIIPRVASMRTSAGCVYRCNFCVVHKVYGRKYFPRKIDSIIHELESIASDYVYFVDDETFLSAAHMRELAEAIKARGIKKYFVSWARSNTITENPDLFRLWHEIGLDILYVGLESNNDETLKKLNKKTTASHNQRAVEILDDIGITLHPAFMVMPDFSEADFQALNDYVQSLPPVEAAFTVYSPSPGTDDWEQNKDNFICDAIKYYDCMHTILPTRLTLKEFYKHFSQLTVKALKKNPLRVNNIPVNPLELMKIIWMTSRYVRIQKNLWKDY